MIKSPREGLRQGKVGGWGGGVERRGGFRGGTKGVLQIRGA